jgi:hypothetical protein
MKLRIASLLFILFVLFSGLHAQTRVLVGAAGGYVYNNGTIGILAAIEAPTGRRFETDLRDEYSPYENHTAVGIGTANLARATEILWMTRRVGIIGNVEFTNYSVGIKKSAYHVLPGIVLRTQWGGSPIRSEFNYVRQANNQMVTGIESAYLQGGRAAFSVRVGCTGIVCYRLGWEFQTGKVRLQSNPMCDGSLPGPITCPRATAWSGGSKGSFSIEFPRRRETELDVF